MPPRYSPTDEPDKLDGEPVEAPASSASTPPPPAATDESTEEDSPTD